MGEKKKNVLFILVDQLGADVLKSYGGALCRTPNLDRIAGEGVVFEQAYTTCPMCSPARASIQTGNYPHNHGTITNIDSPGCMVSEFEDKPSILSRMLERQGYHIGYLGKWHLGFSSLPSSVGYREGDGDKKNYYKYQDYLREKGLEFKLKDGMNSLVNYRGSKIGYGEVVSPVESTHAHYLVNRSIEYLEKWKAKEPSLPFFLMTSFKGPHVPFLPTTGFLDLYRDLKIEPWSNYDTPEGNKPRIHNIKRIPEERNKWANFVENIRYYLGFVSLIDFEIGRILDYLKENGLEKNTVVIFSSDHGESLASHRGKYGKGFTMYEETCKIPLLIRDPDSVDAGSRKKEFVSTTDFYPTILEYAGCTEEDLNVDGRSLVPLLHNRARDWRNYVTTESEGLEGTLFTQRMIRRENYKYVYNNAEIDELYDLAEDPGEIENLIRAPEHAETVRALQEAMFDWMEKTDDRCRFHFLDLKTCVRAKHGTPKAL